MNTLKIVGHRGFPQCYPENSLLGFKEAASAGCHALECDVQLSQNGEVYICHDLNLERCSGADHVICEMDADALAGISVHEPVRFGDRFAPQPVPKLSELVAFALQSAGLHLFVELKQESLHYFSHADFCAKVFEVIQPIADRVTLISFDLALMELLATKPSRAFTFGWVLTDYEASSLDTAKRLKPDFLIADKRILNGERLWQGDWEWFVYDVVDREEMKQLHRLGATWIETWDVSALV